MTDRDPAEPRSAAHTARIARIDEEGRAWIPDSPMPCSVVGNVTRAMLDDARAAGDPVLVMESAEGPVILGVVRETLAAAPTPSRVEIRATDRITLACGPASLVLTKAGKVLIDGTDISTRAVGTQSIKGGTIRVNG